MFLPSPSEKSEITFINMALAIYSTNLKLNNILRP